MVLDKALGTLDEGWEPGWRVYQALEEGRGPRGVIGDT